MFCMSSLLDYHEASSIGGTGGWGGSSPVVFAHEPINFSCIQIIFVIVLWKCVSRCKQYVGEEKHKCFYWTCCTVEWLLRWR